MDRISLAVGLKRIGPALRTRLRALAIIGLASLLGGFTGCKVPGSLSRHFAQQVRPLSDTDRLVRNATYLQKSGRPELAVKELEEAHAREPDNLAILDALIQCYETLGDFKRAQELYAEAEARGLSHPALENNRCYSWFLAGRLDQAEVCFRKLLSRQPDNQAARNNLGLLLCRLGREAEALALWREILDEAGARQRLEQAQAALGRKRTSDLAHKPPVPAASSPGVTALSPPAKETPHALALNSPRPPAGSPPSPSEPRGKSEISPLRSPAPPPLAPVQTPRAKETGVSPEAVSQSERLSGSPPQAAGPEVPRSAASTAVRDNPATAPVPLAGPPAQKVPSSPVAVSADAGRQPSRAFQPGNSWWQNLRIELRNGTGAKGLAREWRSRIQDEGLTVVHIGNHVDFGLAQTTISYRPEAARAAKELARKFFPQARLVEGGKFSRDADVRVSLGYDLLRGVGPPPREAAVQPSKPAVPASVSPQYITTQNSLGPDTFTGKRPGAGPGLADLHKVRLEIRNGNGIPNQAREWRSRLSAEGFSVVDIGNHVDFGLAQTTISYRPEAARAAQELARKFFPKARLEENGKVSPQADIRLSLGLDLVPAEAQISLAP